MSQNKLMADAMNEARSQNEKLGKQFYVSNGYMIVNVQYEYKIPLTSLNTYEKVLGWTWQLGEKTWMTRAHMRHFIAFSCAEAGLKKPMA